MINSSCTAVVLSIIITGLSPTTGTINPVIFCMQRITGFYDIKTATPRVAV